MNRRNFRIAAVAVVLCCFVIARSRVRGNGRQPPGAGSGDAKNRVSYFIADGNARTGYRSSDRELAKWALEAWQRSAGQGLQIEATSESNALIRPSWAEPDAAGY